MLHIRALLPAEPFLASEGTSIDGPTPRGSKKKPASAWLTPEHDRVHQRRRRDVDERAVGDDVVEAAALDLHPVPVLRARGVAALQDSMRPCVARPTSGGIETVLSDTRAGA